MGGRATARRVTNPQPQSERQNAPLNVTTNVGAVGCCGVQVRVLPDLRLDHRWLDLRAAASEENSERLGPRSFGGPLP